MSSMDFTPVEMKNKRAHFCYESKSHLQAARVTLIIAIVAEMCWELCLT